MVLIYSYTLYGVATTLNKKITNLYKVNNKGRQRQLEKSGSKLDKIIHKIVTMQSKNGDRNKKSKSKSRGNNNLQLKVKPSVIIQDMKQDKQFMLETTQNMKVQDSSMLR